MGQRTLGLAGRTVSAQAEGREWLAYGPNESVPWQPGTVT